LIAHFPMLSALVLLSLHWLTGPVWHHPPCLEKCLHLENIVTGETSLCAWQVPVREGASKAIGRLLVYQRKDNSVPSSTTELLPVLSLLLTDDSSDVRRRALRSVKAVAKVNVEGMVAIVGPGVADCLKDSSVPVRMAAERCAFHVFQLARGTSCTALIRLFLFLSDRAQALIAESEKASCRKHCRNSTQSGLCLAVAGTENVQASQKYITGLDSRRIAKQPELR
jgi:hypothetical protein